MNLFRFTRYPTGFSELMLRSVLCETWDEYQRRWLSTLGVATYRHAERLTTREHHGVPYEIALLLSRLHRSREDSLSGDRPKAIWNHYSHHFFSLSPFLALFPSNVSPRHVGDHPSLLIVDWL